MKSKSDFDKGKDNKNDAPSSEMDSADVATGNSKPDVQGQKAKSEEVSEEE